MANVYSEWSLLIDSSLFITVTEWIDEVEWIIDITNNFKSA